MTKNETLDETLFRLGTMKKNGELNITWDEIADMLNESFDKDYCESLYRKRFAKLRAATLVSQPLIYESELSHDIKNTIRDLEKKKMQIRAENKEYRSSLKDEAIMDLIFESINKNLTAFNAVTDKQERIYINEDQSEKVIYAVLSDLHYGVSFKSYYDEYNPDVAKARVMYFASTIIKAAQENNINVCYVSLLGDMVSGIIHETIRLENAENIIDQVTHAAELISDFLYLLSKFFEKVIVNNVSGNHSRIDMKDNALRKERLDDIIPWFCQARLAMCSNVVFVDNELDTSICNFKILGKNYVGVHGDFETSVAESARRISELMGERVDYFISGHKHVVETRFDNTVFIQNGAVVSGGDDYTAKKRLFGPAYQIFMICSSDGIESLHPVKLGGRDGRD